MSLKPQPIPSHEPTVRVNGEERPVPEHCTVQRLLEVLGMRGRRVAVAINRHVVPRSDYGKVVLEADDRIEILEAVGGG